VEEYGRKSCLEIVGSIGSSSETKLSGVTLRRIPRAEVASFTVDQITDNTYLKKEVVIGHER